LLRDTVFYFDAVQYCFIIIIIIIIAVFLWWNYVDRNRTRNNIGFAYSYAVHQLKICKWANLTFR
jgi:hypothetical protein